MASLAAILRLDKTNKKGESPVYFRIIKHRKVNYIASGVKVREKYWDNQREKIKPNHPNYKRLNKYLTKKYDKLQDEIFDYATEHTNFTTPKLKEAILGKPPTSLWKFASDIRQKYFDEGKIGTYDRTGSVIKKLKTYVDQRELFFEDIDFKFIEKYEYYLRTKLGNGTNTITANLKFIKKLFNDAIKYDLIKLEQSPFNKYKMKSEKTQKQYLTEQELKAIEDSNIEKFSISDLARDMFIFSSYSGGIRISDLLMAEKNKFNGTHLLINIKKTGGQISIKPPKKALAIIEKWKDKSSRFIFPKLDERTDFDNPTELDDAISSATSSNNRCLKELAKKIKLKKPLSTHISRHTWATRALRKGITIDKVSKLMGHAQIRETQIYAKIVNEELDKAMDLFNE